MNPLQIFYGLVASMLVTFVGVYIYKCENAKSFMGKAVILAEQKQKEAEELTEKYKKQKEMSDEAHKVAVAGFRSTIKRLRDTNSRYVPPAPTDSRNPLLSCYVRESLDAEIRGFVTTVEDVLAELGEAAVGLNTARAWASSNAPLPHQ